MAAKVKKKLPKEAPKKSISKKEMLDLARAVVGEASVEVVEFLHKKRDISEFEISKKLKIEVNYARSNLYKLYNFNLVSYIRRKDKIKGWYISYWTLNPRGFAELKVKLYNDKLEQLKERLSREETNPNGFFMCQSACVRLDFDQATENGFHCLECGGLLQPQDNSKTIQNLKTRIKELESS